MDNYEFSQSTIVFLGANIRALNKRYNAFKEEHDIPTVDINDDTVYKAIQDIALNNIDQKEIPKVTYMQYIVKIQNLIFLSSSLSMNYYSAYFIDGIHFDHKYKNTNLYHDLNHSDEILKKINTPKNELYRELLEKSKFYFDRKSNFYNNHELSKKFKDFYFSLDKYLDILIKE